MEFLYLLRYVRWLLAEKVKHSVLLVLHFVPYLRYVLHLAYENTLKVFPKFFLLGPSSILAPEMVFTLLPCIHMHAFIYETAYFWKWSGGFVHKYMHQIMRV